jgi:hypothetical protein
LLGHEATSKSRKTAKRTGVEAGTKTATGSHPATDKDTASKVTLSRQWALHGSTFDEGRFDCKRMPNRTAEG